MDAVTLDEVFDLATQLPPADKLRLIERLVPQVAHALEAAHPTNEPPPFPVISVSAWPSDLPMRREELYDDRGR